MKKIQKIVVSIMAIAMMLATYCVPTFAEGAVKAQLYGRVEDNGQAIYKIVLDYGSVKISGTDTDTYTVHVTSTTSGKRPGDEIAYGDFDADRKIVKVEEKGTKVEIYLDENDGYAGTLSYLATGARNIPADITYTVTQNKGVSATATDGKDLGDDQMYQYACDNTVIDEETAKFESVKVTDGINYQYYDAGSADSLIVWFHGNGEGDYIFNGVPNGNNVAQMLANRGTVAWASDEAQNIFGGAHVMAFQAPDTWYYAQRDGLLEKAYNEIQEVIKAKGIDPEKVYVSGCSAGGYMTTRMLIAYPDLFKTAMINCPALDVASIRGGKTPTDDELEVIKQSDTGIWLVQGVTDSSVNTDDCAKRLFNYLTDGMDITETKYSQDIASDYTTYETNNGKYKMSLYETVDVEDKADSFGVVRPQGKLVFAEDFNQDGVLEEIKWSDHWSWIYTLRNNPTDASGTKIWSWAANYQSTVPDTKPENKPEDKPVSDTTESNKPATSVQTGDNTAIAMTASVMLLSAGAYFAIKKYAK